MTTDFEQVDFFADASLNEDPYPYFEHLRAKCPVTALPHHGVVAVSGWDEAADVYRDRGAKCAGNFRCDATSRDARCGASHERPHLRMLSI